jgi:hypothetical protein
LSQIASEKEHNDLKENLPRAMGEIEQGFYWDILSFENVNIILNFNVCIEMDIKSS